MAGLHEMPRDATGFPGRFPSPRYKDKTEAFDAIVDHAIFDAKIMKSFLKTNPYVFTLLRDPVARMVSTVRYHNILKAEKKHDQFKANLTWHFYLTEDGYKTLHYANRGMFAGYNRVAMDLGWYTSPEYAKMCMTSKKTAHDCEKGFGPGNHDLFCTGQTFAQWLNRTVSEFDMGVMLSRFEEGLAILHHQTGIPLHHLAFVRLRNTSSYTCADCDKLGDPVGAERDALLKYMCLDVQIYDRFQQLFVKKWQTASHLYPSIEQDVENIKRMSSELAAKCTSPPGRSVANLCHMYNTDRESIPQSMSSQESLLCTLITCTKRAH
jgi:hypothetical protein